MIIPCDGYLIGTKDEVVVKENEFSISSVEVTKLPLDDCIAVRNKFREY